MTTDNLDALWEQATPIEEDLTALWDSAAPTDGASEPVEEEDKSLLEVGKEWFKDAYEESSKLSMGERLEEGISDVVGIGEAVVSMGTGLADEAAATIAGGIGAIAAKADQWLNDEDPEIADPSEVFMAIHDQAKGKLHVSPTTDEGKNIEAVIGIPFEYVKSHGPGAGDNTYEAVLEAGGTPQQAAAAATVSRTLVEGSLEILGYALPKGIQVRKEMKEKAVAADIASQTLDINKPKVEQIVDGYDSFVETYKADRPAMEQKVIDEAYADYQYQVNAAKNWGVEFKGPVVETANGKGVKPAQEVPGIDYEYIAENLHEKAVALDFVKEELPYIPRESYNLVPKELPAEATPMELSLVPKYEQGKPIVSDPNVGGLPFTPKTLTYPQFKNSPFGINPKTGKPKSDLGAQAAYNRYLERRAQTLGVEPKLSEVPARSHTLSLAEEMTWYLRDREIINKKIAEEEMAWAEKGIFEAEKRIENHISRLAGELPKEVAAELGQSSWGKNQRGSFAPFATMKGNPKGKRHKPTKLSPGHNTFHKTMEFLAGAKSVTMLRAKAKHSPTYDALVRSIEAPERAQVQRGRPSGASVTEARQMTASKWRVELEKAVSAIKPKLLETGREFVRGALPKRTDKQLRAKLLEPTITGKGKVVDAAKNIRALLDTWHKEAVAAGLDVAGYVEGYLPRHWDFKYLSTKKGYNHFMDWASKELKLPALRAEEVWHSIIDNDGILMPDVNAGTWRNLAEGSASKKMGNVEASRTLKGVKDAQIPKQFMKGDTMSTLETYIGNLADRIEYVKRFGKNESVITEALPKIEAELAQKGLRLTESDLTQMSNLLSAINRKYSMIKSPTGRRLQRAWQGFVNMALLPLAVIASLPEAFMTISQVGVTNWARAIPNSMLTGLDQIAGHMYRTFPKTKLLEMAEEIGVSTRLHAAERMAAMTAGELSAVNNMVFRVNGLHSWTKFMSTHALSVFDGVAKRNIAALAKSNRLSRKIPGYGKAKEADMIQFLEQHGINPAQAVEWYNQGMPRNGKFYETYKTGGLRFVNNNVLHPRAATSPMYQNNPHLALISQINRYMTNMGNVYLKQSIAELAANVSKGNIYQSSKIAKNQIEAVTAMVLTGYLVDELVDKIRYGEKGNPRRKKMTKEQKWAHAADRAGLLGTFTRPRDAFIAETWGGSFTSTILGPSASIAEGGAEAIYKMVAGKSNREAARVIARLVPVANITKERREEMADSLEAFLDENFGKPKTKKRKRGISR